MKRRAKLLTTLAILAVGGIGTAVILMLRPQVEPTPRETFAPLVRVERVDTGSVEFKVHAHGTVTPRSESDLIPQVSGPVVWISSALASGGFFEADEPLIRIEKADYEVALEAARAAVARAESENDRATKDLARQKRLAQQSVASASRYDDAKNAERVASAALREAKANLDRANRDIDRTEIRAPYAGRVRAENVDVGQFVTRGTTIATIYAVDYAEVRLPIPDSELRFLDLPMLFRGDAHEGGGPRVELRAQFAGREHTWLGRIVRTEGEIDARSRMVTVIAEVEDPYGRIRDDGDGTAPSATWREHPPLAVGLFVDAEILGRRIEQAVVLPRAALRSGDRVLVVDAENRMHYRDVELLRSERDLIVIGAGLSAGEDVVVSPLPAVVDGMKVRVARNEPDQASLADGSILDGSQGRTVARVPR